MILNISNLNVAFARSPIGKLFSSAISTSESPGPIIVSRPKSPYVPANGTEKAHGSYQFAAVPTGVPAANPGQPGENPEVGFELKPGFKFGRSANCSSKFLDTAVASR